MWRVPAQLPQNRERTLLAEGFVAVAALGGHDARGAARLAFAGLDHVRGRADPCGGTLKSAFGEARAALGTVVHEDRGFFGIGVQCGGNATDVPPVARHEQGKHRDLGVLGGVQSAGEVGFLEAPRVEEVSGDLEPHGFRHERARGKVERMLAEHRGRVNVANLVARDLVGDFDLPEAHRDIAPAFAALDLAHADRGGFLRMGRVLRAFAPHHRDGVLDIEVVHHVGDPLVDVHGTVVHVLVGARTIDRADQLAARLIDDPHILATASAQICQVVRALVQRPIPAVWPAPENSPRR